MSYVERTVEAKKLEAERLTQLTRGLARVRFEPKAGVGRGEARRESEFHQFYLTLSGTILPEEMWIDDRGGSLADKVVELLHDVAGRFTRLAHAIELLSSIDQEREVAEAADYFKWQEDFEREVAQDESKRQAVAIV